MSKMLDKIPQHRSEILKLNRNTLDIVLRCRCLIKTIKVHMLPKTITNVIINPTHICIRYTRVSVCGFTVLFIVDGKSIFLKICPFAHLYVIIRRQSFESVNVLALHSICKNEKRKTRVPALIQNQLQCI